MSNKTDFQVYDAFGKPVGTITAGNAVQALALAKRKWRHPMIGDKLPPTAPAPRSPYTQRPRSELAYPA